jgi:NADH-quinone oxidoreductase subunit G
VLGNLLQLGGFDYDSSDEVLAQLRNACAGVQSAGYRGSHAVRLPANGAQAQESAVLTDVPMYQVDALVRRASSLQRTREGRAAPASY